MSLSFERSERIIYPQTYSTLTPLYKLRPRSETNFDASSRWRSESKTLRGGIVSRVSLAWPAQGVSIQSISPGRVGGGSSRFRKEKEIQFPQTRSHAPVGQSPAGKSAHVLGRLDLASAWPGCLCACLLSCAFVMMY